MPRWPISVILALLGLSALPCCERPRRERPARVYSAPPEKLATPASGPSEAPYATKSFRAMGTRVDLVLPEGPRVEEALELARQAFGGAEAEMSELRPDSQLSAINRSKGEAVKVGPDLIAVLEAALEVAAASGGAFDISWAALSDLWDFGKPGSRPPAPEAVKARLPLVDYRQVFVDRAAGTVRLGRAGMRLGLGGLAKGLALSLAGARLRQAGFASFALSAGGQVLAVGRKNARAWRIGVRDPRGAAADYFALVEIADQSVSTTGDYERFFEHEGKRYCHVLDPKTGWPAQLLRSATVVAPNPMRADALATALMVLGPQAGLELAARLGVEAALVDTAGKVHRTPGLRLIDKHPPKP